MEGWGFELVRLKGCIVEALVVLVVSAELCDDLLQHLDPLFELLKQHFCVLLLLPVKFDLLL